MKHREGRTKMKETELGRKLVVLLAAAILTTEAAAGGEGGSGGEGGGSGEGEGGSGGSGGEGGAGGEGGEGSGGEGGGSGDDLSKLFSPEEIEARRVEAERRAALTDEQRAEEDRIKAEEAAKNAPPEEYADFAVADGIVLDPVMISEFKPLAKELGLNQEKAQKLVDLAVKVQQRTIDGIFAMHEERKATWLKDAQNDAEIGEDVKKWDPANPDTVKDSVALRAFNSIAQGHPGLKGAVDELGIGNHPEFIRMFYRIGKMMREDTFELGGGGGKGAQSTANALWPGMK